MPAVSVIVPVYNVEAYLAKCVQSLLDQTFSDLEILLVDDGSTDKSLAICDEYAAKDARIRVIHKENGGLSSARNAGIEAARGRYIGFVDSDDYVEPEMYERLYTLAEREGADIAIGSFRYCYADREKAFTVETAPSVCTGREALGRALRREGIANYVWTRLVRREIFDRGLRFAEGRVFEDVHIMPEMLLAAEKVAVDDRPMYNYVKRAGSIATGDFSPRSMDCIWAYEYVAELVRERCPEYLPVAESRLYAAYFYVLDKLLKEPDFRRHPQFAPVMKYLRQNARQIIGSPYRGWKRRLGMMILYVSPGLYRVFMRWLRKRLAFAEEA